MRKITYLGNHTVTYCRQSLRWRFFFLQFLPACFIVLTIYGYGKWIQVQATNKYGPIIAEKWSKPWYVLSGFTLIILIIWLLQRVKEAHSCLHFYKKGMLIQRPFHKSIPLFWKQIQGISISITDRVFVGKVIHSQYTIVIYPNIGQNLKIQINSNYYPEIISRIKAKIYPRLHSQLRENLDSGEILDFGDVHLSKYKLYTDKENTPWKQVRLVDIRDGSVVIELKNQKAISIPIKNVMNLEVMMQIIQNQVVK
ncbi:MAG TPA: hypothetical protein G4N95_06570 [Anaerolineae bacterium]|nr:hypothetical protein [Anaerolineae bacterium]